MATLRISGDNSNYTLTLSGMSTSLRYHVFIVDLTSSGGINGYKCVRSSLGTSSNWTYKGSSNAPFSNYERDVYVRSTTSATSHSVGKTYTWDEVFSGTSEVDSGTIPAAGGSSSSYKIKVILGNGVKQVGYGVNTSSASNLTSADFTKEVGKDGYLYITIANYSANYSYPVTATSDNGSSWTVVNENGEYEDHYISAPSSSGTRTVTLDATLSRMLSVGGTWPEILSKITFTDGTSFSINNTSMYYSQGKTIKSITVNSKAAKWIGTLYWGSSAGSTSYPIADIRLGTVTMRSPIEEIDYTSRNRTIYLTAVGSEACAIVFNYNGGRYGNETGETTIYEQMGANFTINRTPTHDDGYNFIGWKRAADGIIYQTGQSFKISNTTETLTAQWGIKCYFKLAVQSEGITSYQVYKGNSLVLSGNNTSWNEANSVYFSNTDSASINVTLKNIYNGSTLVNANGFEIPTITAYKNSSLSSATSDKLQIKTEGSPTIQPTYKNYSIDMARKNGWVYFSIVSSPKYYNYKLYANDGTWPARADPQQGSIKSTEQLNLANFNPTRSGYVQLGWHTMSTAALPSESYPISGSIYLTGNLTLYAVWTKKYYIIFDANGGKWSNRASTTKPCEAYYKKVIYLGDESAGDVQRLSRGGHKLKGWSDTSKTTMKYLPGEKFECPNRTENLNMYAIWDKQTIDKFYWYNNDIQDNTYIAEGKPITNLKASAWNRLKDKIEEIAEAIDISLPNSYSTTRVDSTTEISAQDYNGIRSAIINFPGAGTGPKVAAKGTVIGASMFVGTTSLKGAINRAIDQWNNS